MFTSSTNNTREFVPGRIRLQGLIGEQTERKLEVCLSNTSKSLDRGTISVKAEALRDIVVADWSRLDLVTATSP